MQKGDFLADVVLNPHHWAVPRTSFKVLTHQDKQLPSYLNAKASPGKDSGTSEF